MHTGLNTKLEVKRTSKDNRAVYSQNLPIQIHLKEDLIVEFVLLQKNGIITVLSFPKFASLNFAQRKPNGILRLFVDLRKINTLIAVVYTNNNHPVSILSDAAQHLAGKSLFCKHDCPQSYHCLQMAAQRSVEMLAFFFEAELLPTKDLHKASADLCLLFQASCASTLTQPSRLTNVLNTWTIMELQPILLRISPGTIEQSSSSFAKPD